MKRILKVFLVVAAAVGLSGYTPVPMGDAVSQVREGAAVAAAPTPAPESVVEAREPSEWTLLLCGFLVVGVIARRKSQLLAP